MVKVPDTPVAYVVADITRCPKLSLVCIVFAMATDALTWRVLESLSSMTILACHFQMASQQGEACLRVIKSHALPACLAVTTLTTCALLTGVDVILPMTRQTIDLQFLPERAIRVTTFALQLLMTSNQPKSCFLVMIKPCRFPVCFLVTGFALGAQ